MGGTLASLLTIATALLVGSFLLVVPWTAYWDTNYLLPAHPALRGLLLSPFARGAVSGLGFVNVLVALHDAHTFLLNAADRG